MSKFDERYNEILNEIAPVVAAVARPVAGAIIGQAIKKVLSPKEENANPANVAQAQTTTGSNQPVTNPQVQAQLKNPQAVEKIADELANINDPNKIKQILTQLVQGITNPKTAG